MAKRASIKNNSPLDAMFQPSTAPAAKQADDSPPSPVDKPATRQTSVFLTEDQITWLDNAALQAKREGGKAIRKAVVLRTLVEIAMQTPLDLTGVQSEEEVRERMESALKSL